ncbi:N-acetylmuramoyl-L-alanine amidase [Dactylosporangium sp. NPDC048998]|uniref:N-acetylmuramoyl-L-alanine amidase n=1 Tax=Dactylosporangium sp. NPDC048998 TaxID=3363976 RepID=UPI0037110B98
MRRIAATTFAGIVLGAAIVPAAGSAAEVNGRRQDFADASVSAGVPNDVLLAVSYLESRWNTNHGAPSTGAGFGPMHLTDAAAVTRGGTHHDEGTEDARGEDAGPARPARVAGPAAAAAPAPALQTLDQAAALTGVDKARLRTDARENIRGGAALLAAYQRDLGAPGGAGSDPAAWYGAVARYSGADTADAAAQFADEVFATMREGADRVTDDGQRVTLPAHPGLRPQTAWLDRLADRLGLRRPARPDGLECPPDLPCEWIPAPYADLGGGDYGNHDLSDRPARQRVQYIVIHDTEATYDTTIGLVQDPAYVSWNYTIRSADGHVAQHVKTKDVAWHAGNWYVNATSVGIEHEGFAAEGAWYTEAMYRSSAKLVRYLAGRLGIPLDRGHIIGHDNVPGTVPSTVRGMHWDPGPFWDWGHYFDLLHAPFRATGTARTGLVTIDPDYDANRPAFTGCTGASGNPCPEHGASQLILHTAPDAAAPLLLDPGLHPDGGPSTMLLSDHGSRVSAGQTYAVAGRQGDWTAVWYLGQKGWFSNPPAAPTAKWATGLVAVPRPGRDTIPVYGRAYPEQAAYSPGVPYQPITPLQYTFAAGQRYAVTNVVQGEYYRAVTFDGSSPGDWTVIRGATWYAQIQFGHRVMYVNLDDVQILPSLPEATPTPGSDREHAGR